MKDGSFLYGKPGAGKVKYDKYMNKYKPDELKIQVPHMSKTKLKRMLYSLINRRDKLEKKNIGPQVTVDEKYFVWSLQQAPDTQQIKDIKEAILIITDEVSHREFAKMCPDTDTNTIGDKKE